MTCAYYSKRKSYYLFAIKIEFCTQKTINTLSILLRVSYKTAYHIKMCCFWMEKISSEILTPTD